MDMYSDLNYNDSGYVDGDSVINGDCDYLQSLTDTLNLMYQRLNNIEAFISSVKADIVNGIDISLVDFTPFHQSIEASVGDVVSQGVSGIIANASLNGYGAEFADGDTVLVEGRDTVYVVGRSFFSMYADNAYTIHYDIQSQDGKRMIVPEALLTKHIV